MTARSDRSPWWPLLAAAVILAVAPAASAPVADAQTTSLADRLLPLMRAWRPAGGTMRIGPRPAVAIGASSDKGLEGEARRLAADLSATTGMAWAVRQGDGAAGDVRLRVVDAMDGGREAYRLRVGDTVVVEASAAPGLYYGGRTILQMLRLGGGSLPRGTGDDAPAIATRAVMLDVGRRYFQVPNLLAFIRTMGDRKLNTLHLHFNDWQAFRLDSPRYPGLAPRGAAYTREDIRAIEAEAARHHVEIIPEIDLPAHAVALTDYRPSLGFRCPSMRTSSWLRNAAPDIGDKAWTVDVGKAENRAWLKGLLEEFIPWFSGPKFHVGGDEYQFDEDKNRCPELVAATKRMGLRYPGDVMVRWLDEANAVVKAHGKRTVAWSWWGYRDDRLSIAPARDIIVEVWNPAMEQPLVAAGHDVILSPEAELYVTPGEELTRNGRYGLFDLAAIYERYAFRRTPQILGYSLNVWADGAERHTDDYFIGRAGEPMLVMSERLWTGRPRGDVWELLRRSDPLEARRPR